MKMKFIIILFVFGFFNIVQMTSQNIMTLDFGNPGPVINKNIYGQFAEHLGRCVYDGIWVGPGSEIPNVNGYRKDVLEALQDLKVPVLRWPGGCFADTYHWKDGVGAVQKRPSLQNAFWGNTIEDNSFGTHEFLDLCEMLGADAYISANIGSGTVREMVEWIEYMTSDLNIPMANWRRQNGREKPWDVKFLGVGNESWGCGGDMTPEFYADLLRQYGVFAKQYGGGKFQRVGCGSNGDDVNWTEVLMKKAGKNMDALSLHQYTIATGDWGAKSAATGFDESLYFKGIKQAMKMDDVLQSHIAIMDKYDSANKLGLMVDEWGIWTESEPGTNSGHLYQQNSMRDALIASLTFDIFHRYANRVQMANIAQVVNVLQAMILTQGDEMILTPTYHVFKMYNVHQDANYIPVSVVAENYKMDETSIPNITGTASKAKDGKVHISLSNLNPNKEVTIQVNLEGGNLKKVNYGTMLTAPAFNSVNTFDKKEVVKPVSFSNFKLSKNTLTVKLPAHAVAVLELQ